MIQVKYLVRNPVKLEPNRSTKPTLPDIQTANESVKTKITLIANLQTGNEPIRAKTNKVDAVFPRVLGKSYPVIIGGKK